VCGRYTITADINRIRERFLCPTVEFDFYPRYNVAPTQIVPVIINNGSRNELRLMRWGLVPYWAKEMSIGNKLINARIETVSEKPAFKAAVRKRRCIVPADGYFEWQKVEKAKRPMRIVLKSREIFGFAGIWDTWENSEGDDLQSFSILTTEPVEAVGNIHNRMPVILNREFEQYWLNGAKVGIHDEIETFLSLIRPVDEIEAYPVSKLVNSPKNDVPEVIDFIKENE